MKVILAYDGSEWANAAIDGLCRSGLARDTEASVVSVANVNSSVLPIGSTNSGIPGAVEPSSAPTRSQRVAMEAVEKAHALAEQGAQRVRTLFPAWKVSTETRAGSPPEEIIKKAEEWRADLIVVGSCGQSALGRMAFGSISQKLARYAPCSVRVARRRDASCDTPVRIVVGADGSDGARTALRMVATRAWPAGSEARVIVALDQWLSTSLPTFDDDGEVWAQRMAHGFVEELQDSGLLSSSVLRRGDPKIILVEEAAQWEADCIFVGAKGMSRLERFLLGSVSWAVASRAHCSVEVARAVTAGTRQTNLIGADTL